MTTATATKYEVKNVKSFEGMEGYGFNCSLYKDGKRIGTVLDDANGGSYYYMLDKGEEEALRDYCKALPMVTYDFEDTGELHHVFDDSFISDLVEEYENNARIKRLCRTKTLYSLKTDEEGTFWTIKAKYSERVRDHLTAKHGDNLTEIINERFTK